MRKSFFVFTIVSLVFSSAMQAQFNDVKLINAGVSIGLYGKYYDDNAAEILTNESISRPIHFQYETGIANITDLEELSSNVTVGIYAGFQAQQKYAKDYDAGNSISKEAYKQYYYLWGGAVGTLHAVGLANKYLDISIPADTWDVYFSARLGLVYGKSKRNYELNPSEVKTQIDEFEFKSDKTYLYMAPVLGVRYYLLDKFSLFGEIGYANLSVLTLGASMKLNKE
jgi:hypothetical protein